MTMKEEPQKLQLTTVWKDGFKSSISGTDALLLARKTLEAVRRAGGSPPITLRHDLVDLLVGPEGALHGGVHTYTGFKPYQFIAERI